MVYPQTKEESNCIIVCVASENFIITFCQPIWNIIFSRHCSLCSFRCVIFLLLKGSEATTNYLILSTPFLTGRFEIGISYLRDSHWITQSWPVSNLHRLNYKYVNREKCIKNAYFIADSQTFDELVFILSFI